MTAPYLEQLSNAMGVSGDEAAVRAIVIEAIKAHVTDLHIDALGNVTAFKAGKGKSNLRVMIAAHMDEVGFMITGHENNGTLRFKTVGGVPARILPALRLQIGANKLPGVILWAPIHVNRDQNVKEVKALRIDIGATSKSAAEQKVKLGTRATFDSTFTRLNDTMLRGKAFDDRVGCSLLIDLLQSDDYECDIVAAFTVQEEIGLRGAQVIAQRWQPDMAIVLENTTAHDVPDPDADPDSTVSVNPACRLGNGPVLTVMDRSMITAPHLLQFARQTAEQHGIPYQLKTALGGGTDAGRLHQSNTGIPSLVISTPCRYIHSPLALLNQVDYQHDLKLVQALLNTLTPESIQFT